VTAFREKARQLLESGKERAALRGELQALREREMAESARPVAGDAPKIVREYRLYRAMLDRPDVP
jgi:hypothetical protein